MKLRTCTFFLVLTPVFLADYALAQDTGSDDEVTITIMEDAEALLPDAVIRVIELPDPAQGQAKGLEKANEARANERRAAGLDRAEQARSEGRERGEQASEDARNNREDHGRPEDPGRPDNLPTPPGR